MTWSFILSDISGNNIGEVVNAAQKSVALGINRISTASFNIRPDNALFLPLMSEDTLLKVYENNTLRFYGNVVSSAYGTQENGSAPTIQVNAADPAWRLSRRLLGLSSGGTSYGPADKALIARAMVNELNTNTEVYTTGAHGSADIYTGLRLLSEGSYSAGSTGTYVAGPFKSALSCINDLAHTLDGFDWRITPVDEHLTEYKPIMGIFEANGIMGSTKSNAVMEYGYGKTNVKKLEYTRDLSNLANRAFNLPDEGFSEGGTFKQASDVTSIGYRGLYEEVADAFGVTDVNIRQQWVEEVIRVKANPRYVAAMTLDIDDGTGRVPKFGTDFSLGDLVPVRAVDSGVTMFNGLARVYAVEVKVDDNGTPTVTPVLIDEEGESLAP